MIRERCLIETFVIIVIERGLGDNERERERKREKGGESMKRMIK